MLKVHLLGNECLLTNKVKQFLEEKLGVFQVISSSVSGNKVNPDAEIVIVIPYDWISVLDILEAYKHGKPIYVLDVQHSASKIPKQDLKEDSDYCYQSITYNKEEYHYFKVQGLIELSKF